MPAITTPGVVAEFTHRSETVRFFVGDVADLIQNKHLNGLFYEEEELAIIARHVRAGWGFLDVGANVGNHTVYVGKFCHPGFIIAIEPNPPANNILRLNLALNGVRADVFALAFSDQDGRAEARWPTHNLGGARMFEQTDGRVPMARGDDLVFGKRFGLIKIDVEGSEMRVLEGLRKTIEWNNPAIFVEVDNANAKAMEAWCSANGYEVAERFRRYRENENLLLRPQGGITRVPDDEKV